MTHDLYVWQSPRDVDVGRAEALLGSWLASGGDPAQSPFEPSSDVGWFHRELMKDALGLDVSSDAVPNASRAPIWLSTEPEPPARVVAIRLPPDPSPDVLESIFGLAMKYDLVLFDARSRRVHLPLDEMTAYADATFWPSGAIQAAVAGGIGAVIAIVAWVLSIPVLSGVLVLVGGLMFASAVLTFVQEGRKAVTRRRSGGEPPSGG